jgi:hypothetical protein
MVEKLAKQRTERDLKESVLVVIVVLSQNLPSETEEHP